MNKLTTPVLTILCCVLLLSYPLGFVTPVSASATSSNPGIDFCDPVDGFDPLSMSESDIEAAADEAMMNLPRWYQDVARGNSVLVHLYEKPEHIGHSDPLFNPLWSFKGEVGENFQTEFSVLSTFPYQMSYQNPDGTTTIRPQGTLTVETDCQTLNHIRSSDDIQDAIVDSLWEGDIIYYGQGPGADAAVVYSQNLLTGAYMLEHRQIGDGGDFFLGFLAPVTKTQTELELLRDKIGSDTREEPISRSPTR